MRRAGVARRSTPLVPKELILPVCQRFAFVLFAMCSTALGIRLYARWKLGMLGGHPVGRISLNPLNETRFFLDISVHTEGKPMDSKSKNLEEAGWKGALVKAFPEADRSCEKIAMPIAITDGEQVSVADCAAVKPSLPQVVLSAFSTKFSAACPVVQRPGVGIEALLKLSKAPPVIDYVSLDTEGTEKDILQRFPFKEHCVRAWAVNQAQEGDADVQALFIKQECRVRQTSNELWARCPCEDFAGGSLGEDFEDSLKGQSFVQIADEKPQTPARKASPWKVHRKQKRTPPMKTAVHIGSEGTLMRHA